jgi:hypothetical protein
VFGKNRQFAAGFAFLALAAGCESMNHTDKGILGGGTIGGLTGAAIGSASGNTGAGAAIGAGVGALSGGLIGNEIDKSESKTQAQIVQASATVPVQGPLALPDIAQMTRSGLSDAVIIGQIRSTRSTYALSPQDLEWLKSQGVTDGVILEMQSTAGRVAPAPRVYARPYGPDVVYVERFPPPPVVFGFGWGPRYRRCW